MKPDLSVLTTSQLCELVTCNPRTMARRLSAEGVQPCRIDGRARFYRPPEALAAYFATSALNPSAEQARLSRARAEAVELGLARDRGELAPIADVEHVVAVLLSGVKSALLAIPAAVAEDLAATDDPAECHLILATAIDEALRALADAEIEVPKTRPTRRRR